MLIEKDFDQYGLEEITEGKIKEILFSEICVCNYLTKKQKKKLCHKRDKHYISGLTILEHKLISVYKRFP